MLRVFGPARVDGSSAGGRGLPSRRQRQLLAALACRPGRILQTETLAEWLWGEQIPADPSAAVQTLVHRLRRSVAPQVLIETRGTGYLLVPPEDGVDVILFEDHVRAARAAEPPTAVARLGAALALWQGEPLVDLDHRDHIAERVRLEALADEARALLMRAYLSLGRHNEAIVLAEDALGNRPDDEQALAVLMTGLYATGHHVSALHRYSTHRQHLADELGLDPSPELRDLEQAILRRDLPLAGGPPPEPPGSTHQDVGPDQSPDQAPEITQHIQFCRAHDGTRLAYASSGHGPPLVKAATWLTHLNDDWDSPVWRHWMAGLSRDHALLRYDERGCGLSEWDVPDISFETWVDDLEAVVDAAGLDTFPLLGISQGAAVAVAYAVRHPERVRALVLYGGYARGRNLRAASAEARREASLHLELARVGWGSDDPAFRQVFTSQIIPDASQDLWAAFNTLQSRTCSPDTAVRFMQVFGDIDVTETATRVTCPTLVMHSRDEVRQPVQIGLELAALIPASRFVPLPSRNHLLTADEPAFAMFLDQTHAFLAEHAS